MHDYTPMEKVNPAFRTQYESYFKTTIKYQIYDWLASLIIVPTYFLCTYLLLSSVETIVCAPYFTILCGNLGVPDSLRPTPRLFSWLYWLGIFVAMIPVLLSLYSIDRPWWRLGFRERGLLAFVAAVFSISAFSSFQSSYQLASFYVGIFMILVIRGLYDGYYWIPIEKRKWVKLSLVIAVSFLILLFLILSTMFPNASLIDWKQFFMIVLKLILIFDAIIIVMLVGNRLIRHSLSITSWTSDNRSLSMIVTCWILFALSFIVVIVPFISIHGVTTLNPISFRALLLSPNSLPNQSILILRIFQSILWLTAMIVAAHPALFMSRQRAYIRKLTASMRYDRLRHLVTPLLVQTHPINRLRYRLRKFFSSNNVLLAAILIFIFSGFGIPLYSAIVVTEQSEATAPSSVISFFQGRFLTLDNLWQMMFIGIPSALIFTGLYIGIIFVNARQKYVILPFILEGSASDKESLKGVASQLQHGLVDQIQKIGFLLQLRQIENLRTSSEAGLTRFVASGQGLDFTEELRSLSILDVTGQDPNSRIGRLLYYLVNTLAIVKVRGSLRRRADNSLQVWIELNRQGQSFPIDMAIVPTNFSEDIDEITIQNLTRALATKLVQKVGNNYHLGSSEESLECFLNGLKAAIDENWWSAIDLYRTSIQIEEAAQGSFALGHYHLGSALVSVGELEDGIKHLEQAEHGDPLFAETRYMLALTKIYKYWDNLHEREPNVEFQKAKQNCILALKLRSNFAEAYHLLGSAHYHRGKLLERSKTKTYDENDRNEKTKHEMEKREIINDDYRSEYKEAAKFFHKAIHAYDKELHRVSHKTTWQNNSETEVRGVFRARMTATHQMGDALRSLRYFAEADTYYEEVNTVYPNNLRTLADNAKLYCLAQQWQRADEFLSRKILNIPESHWNADVNIHMGWALAGGISESNDPVWRLFGISLPHEEQIRLLTQATQHLDFAVHQRPRYMTSWSQTDWQHTYMAAYYSIDNKNNWRQLKKRIVKEIEKKLKDIESYQSTTTEWMDEKFINDLKDSVILLQSTVSEKTTYHCLVDALAKHEKSLIDIKKKHEEHVIEFGTKKEKDFITYRKILSDLYWNPTFRCRGSGIWE